MTTFRCEVAVLMIDDLLADTAPWWDGELQTVTGHSRTEYELLRRRLVEHQYQPDLADRKMLHQAANNLLGYPGISTNNVVQICGVGWRDAVSGFLMPGSQK